MDLFGINNGQLSLLPVDDVMCHFIFDVFLILREGLQFVEQSKIVSKLHDVCFDHLENCGILSNDNGHSKHTVTKQYNYWLKDEKQWCRNGVARISASGRFLCSRHSSKRENDVTKLTTRRRIMM